MTFGFGNITSFFGNAANTISKAVEPVITTVSKDTTGALGYADKNISQGISAVDTHVYTGMRSIYNGAIGDAAFLGNTVKNSTNTVIKDTGGAVHTFSNDIGQIDATASKDITNFAGTASKDVVNFGGTAKADIIGAGNTVKNDVIGAGNSLVSGIKNDVNGAVSWITNGLKSIELPLIIAVVVIIVILILVALIMV